jgi:hypothetical protein
VKAATTSPESSLIKIIEEMQPFVFNKKKQRERERNEG